MKQLLSLAVAIAILLPATDLLAQGQVVVKGEDEQEFKHSLKTDTKGRLQNVQAQNLLDACDVKTDWTALSNDTTGIDEDLDHVEGAASLEFDKVDGTDNSVIGGCDKTLGAAVDIAHYMENNGFILVSINVSATTDIDYCFVRLGTDASNYNEWRVDDDALSVGWQQVRFPFYVPSTAGNLGNGIAATSVSYVAVGCAFDLETDTLADLRVDNLAVNTGFQTSADLQSQVATAAATPNINVVKIASQPVDVGAGAVGLGTQRNTLASDDPAVTSLGIVDDWDEVHDAAVGTDGALHIGESKDFDGAVLPNVVDTEGDAVRLALSLYGTTYVMPVSEDGSETPLVAHDTPISAANGGSSGFMPMGESKDFDGVALPNVVDTEGDAVRPASSLYGVRYVMLVNEDGSAVGTILTSSEYLDDSGYTVTTDYVGAVGYIADTAAVDSVEEDDIGIPRMSLNRVPLGMIWDAGGNERGAHVTAGNAVEMDVAEQSLTALKVSATAAANALGNPLFFQISQDGTDAVDAAHPLPISKDMAANATGNRIWVKSDTDMVGGVAANVNGGNRDAGTQTVAIADDDNVSTKLTDIEGNLTSDNDAKELADYFDSTSQLPPLYVDDATLLLDNEPLADVMAEVYELLEDVRVAASSDGMAYTKDGVKTEAVVYLDTGADLDMAKAGATGGVQVETVNWPNSYDSANAQQDLNIKNRTPVQPAKQGPTAVDNVGGGVVGDIVLTGRAIQTDNRWCVHIVNVGGGTGDILSDAILLTSPTGAAGEWESMPWTVCDTLANSGFSCSYCSDTARAYVQVEALCGVGDDTTVSAWYRARK